jgi:fucose permease
MQKIQKIAVGVGLIIVAAVCFISAMKEHNKRAVNIAIGSAFFILGAGCIKFRQSPDTVILQIPRR